jgi:hypothetical protein
MESVHRLDRLVNQTLLGFSCGAMPSFQVEAGTGSRGPRLTAVDVPGVDAVAVAHRMSADEHIKVIGDSYSLLHHPHTARPS